MIKSMLKIEIIAIILLAIIIILFISMKMDWIEYTFFIERIISLFLIGILFYVFIIRWRRKQYKRSLFSIIIFIIIVGLNVSYPPYLMTSKVYESSSMNDSMEKELFLWAYVPHKIAKIDSLYIKFDEVYMERKACWKTYNRNDIVPDENSRRLTYHYSIYTKNGFKDNSIIRNIGFTEYRIKDGSMQLVKDLKNYQSSSSDTLCIIINDYRNHKNGQPIDTVFLYPIAPN